MREGDGGVVDQHELGEVAVDDAQVLDVDAVAGLHAGLAEEAVGHELALRVQLVDHHVRVAAVRGREDDDLEHGGQLLQHARREGPHVDARLR